MKKDPIPHGNIYQDIFDIFPAAIFIIGKNASDELSFIDVNREAEKQFRVTRRQLIGAPLGSAFGLLRDIPFCNTLLAMAYEPQQTGTVSLPLTDGSFAVCILKKSVD
ncbi:MAG: hypothetical protein LBL37_07365 [Gracilibacteraceae bacterium]|jgi:PAS domain-containing protein|nr:hypothetical protein [Gracilibacteraceae bacterium]